MRIEGKDAERVEAQIHSIIARLQNKHGICKSDFDLAILEQEPLVFSDGSELHIQSALWNGEEIPNAYELSFFNKDGNTILL